MGEQKEGRVKNFPVVLVAVLFTFTFTILYQAQKGKILPAGGEVGASPPQGLEARETPGGILATLPASSESPPAPLLLSREMMEKIDALSLQVAKAKFPPPDIEVQDVEGKSVSLTSFRGKVIVVNFWASWCKECEKEMPSLEALWKTFQNQNFAFLAINWKEPVERAQSYLMKQGYQMPLYLDISGKAGESFKVTGVPETYIITSDYFLAFGAIGPKEWDSPDAIRFIRLLLEGKGISENRPHTPRSIPATSLYEEVRGSPRFLLLDLRGEEVYAQGHVRCAFNFPPPDLMQHMDILPYDFPIVLISEDEQQAEKIASALAGIGYEQMMYLENGMKGWTYPLTTEDPLQCRKSGGGTSIYETR